MKEDEYEFDDEAGNESGTAQAPESAQASPVKKTKAKKAKKTKKISSRETAKAIVAAKKAEIEAKKSPAWVADNETTVWYLACNKQHPGVFFTEYPDGDIHVTKWWSADKDPDQMWPANKVSCQVCRQPMRMAPRPGDTWHFNKRFVRQMSRDQFEELAQEAV